MPLQTVCPLPPREAVRQLYNTLLQRGVVVDRAAPTLDPTLGVPMAIAAYTVDGGRIAAVGLWDLPLAAATSVSMAVMPERVVGETLTAGAMDEALREVFHEIANITTKLLNSPTTPHVVLRGVDHAPTPLPRDTLALLDNPVARLDYEVRIDGYGAGQMSMMAW